MSGDTRPTVTRAQARAIYDRVGRFQDRQGFYEDAATRDMVAHGRFASATSVVEFGCGTGRFAKDLLEQQLTPTARYRGFDASPVMVEIARERLDRFGRRATVELTDGDPRLPVTDTAFDRFVSNYVLDLLSEADAMTVVNEARRILAAGGLLCLVSLTFGFDRISRLVERVWSEVHARRPAWVGGCRPIELAGLLPESDWEVQHRRRLAPFGVPSEVLVAARRA